MRYDKKMYGRAWANNLLITAIGLILFGAVNAGSGRLEANDGLGWDGRQYAHMVTARIYDGTVATQTRPLLPLLTRVPYKAGLEIVPAFELMNFVYGAALYFSLGMILDLYDVSPVHKAYFVITVALSIATSKIFAFYPTLIDLGALAVLSWCTYIVLTRPGWAAGAAAVLAVTTREFSVALAFFGFHRELRQGRGFVRALFTYTPAVLTLFLIRQWASVTNLGDRNRALLTTSDFIANLHLWTDRPFVVFFLYFLITLLGGVTMLLLLKPSSSVRQVAAMPELLTFAILIVGAAAVGNADIWRYLVFLLPVIAILFGAYVKDVQPGPVLLTAALLVTLITQQPFAHMEMSRYFRDWFPGYVYRTDEATSAFWSTWRLRIALTCGAAVALGIVQWWTLRAPRELQPEAPSQ